MSNYNQDTGTSKERNIANSVEGIRQRKTELLFQYLKEKLELDRQLRLLNVSEEMALINREHEQALNELFLREAK